MAVKYLSWSCDVCTATCTFEAMMMCVRRRDPDALCGYDRDLPLAHHPQSSGRPPDHEGAFDFVVEVGDDT